MNTIATAVVKTPIGELLLGDFEGKLCLCDWLYRSKRNEINTRICKALNSELKPKQTPLLLETEKQLAAYFAKEINIFDLPLMPVGTDFQKKVWLLLSSIEYGKTLSYAQLSMQFGNKLAIRAIASANGANALSIVIPCHRVVGSQGELVGYAGGLAAKKHLLDLENPMPSLF